jgi:hypothetical protein
MKKLNVPFYVSTNNKHMRCLQVFVELFNKFTDNSELIILGYDKPDFELTENCKFESMGIQGPVEEWSTDLRKYFLKNAPDYFIYGTEDTFFYKNIDHNYINYLIKVIELNKQIGKVQLCDIGEENGDSVANSRHYKSMLLNTIKVEELDIDFDMHALIESNYIINCQLSLWNKEYIIKYLEDGYSPWDFELKGSQAAKDDTDWCSVILDKQYGIFKKEGFCGSLEPEEQWTYKESWLHLLDSEELKSTIKNWK